ncbi:GNAT family N-acetyltransferase [Comamonas sp. JC664]|uniref:GNAT family N-acetyltransferase n=1 Tax=Comamonas sp. JC664 TaxID=2801917 RepID=UPI00174C4608|nr:GNAT family N-acetyltransferase [Comamonas sp. JC664]MBL0694660.1 GNAT family N-acetyltransferase [Comamonas sp. JC664]GHG96529.1 hypothetical protein GCM10012319_61070 [Comamonas sp. KCTC 72670]
MPETTYQRLRSANADLTLMQELNAVFAVAFEDPEAYAQPPEDDYLRAILGREETVVLVARVDGQVVGGLVAYELPKLERRCSELYVYDLAIAPPFRRQGIATELFTQLKKVAADRGIPFIFVQADAADAPAVGLYAGLGAREDVAHFDIATSKS